MRNIKVYLKPTCPYCRRVKKYLEDNNHQFEEIDVTQDTELYDKLKKETNHMTVPQVFIDDKFIGGSDDFFDFVKSNNS